MKSPFLIDLPGTEISADDEKRLNEIQPKGIIVFGHNYLSKKQLKEFIASVKILLGNDTIIAVDHEGGRVVRFPEILPDLPSAQTMARFNDASKVCNYAKESGLALKELGITLNLAPLADVAGSTTNLLLLDRCFGNDPVYVGEMCVAFIEGMHEAGVQCTVKHFPGLGPAGDDTHQLETLITLDQIELETLWQPFLKAIEAGVDAVMIGHAAYPSLDMMKPATFSERIISFILRRRLGFGGLIISDDLEMGAIKNNYSIEEAIGNCLSAGCDLLTICKNIEHQKRAYKAICK